MTAGGVLAYRTGSGTKTQLTWVDRAGKILDTAEDPGQPLVIALSADEKQVAIFHSDTQSSTAGGATDVKLIKNLGHPAGVTDWTRDGRFLIYDEGAGGQGVRELSIDGDDPIPVITEASAGFGGISRDSHWIAYRSNRSGRLEVYVRPYAIPGSGTAPAGPVIQISRDGGSILCGAWMARSCFSRTSASALYYASRSINPATPSAGGPRFAWISDYSY